MKTKIVYVIVSSPSDIYLEQALLSIYSLRLYNPNAEVIIFIDDITEAGLNGSRRSILDLVNKVVVIQRDRSFSAKESASYIKTIVRSKIKGDFLFIDTDTIINKDLSDIDNCNYEIAAVPDAHARFSNHFNSDQLKKIFSKLGFSVTSDNYFNSGVLYVKDTQRAHLLYSRWNNSYYNKRKECFYDQPHLAYADSIEGIIKELDGVWNCQVQFGVRYFSNAKIIHYFASNFINNQKEYSYKLMDKEIFLKIKESGTIPEEIKNLLKNEMNQWNESTEIVGGKDVVLQHSSIMKIVRYVYYNHKRIFSFMEKMLNNTKTVYEKAKSYILRFLFGKH